MSLTRTVLLPEIIRVSRVAAMRLGSNLQPGWLWQGKSDAETANFQGTPCPF